MKIVIAIALAVVVIILTFTLMPTGADATEITQGYSNTRQYATSNLQLINSADNYKNVIETAKADEDRRNNATFQTVDGLGTYGSLASPETYTTYTADKVILMSANDIYGSAYQSNLPNRDISCEAEYVIWSENSNPDALNYLTLDNTPCDDTANTEVGMFGAAQCAAFGAWYVNMVSYKDYVKEPGDAVMTGSCNITQNEALASGTCWRAHTGRATDFKDDIDGLKRFFYGVTPGTFIRTHPITGQAWGHSYIILGADDNNIVIYDCNAPSDCGIRLKQYTWDEFVSTWWLSRHIECVISPPGTPLPQGCLDGFDNCGAVQ